MPSTPVDSSMAGRVIGRLTVLGRSAKQPGDDRPRWDCRCECGKVVRVGTGDITGRRRLSCGCLRMERVIAARKTHGATFGGGGTSEYRIWTGMKQRCLNPRNTMYGYYGGRGITVCERWRESFAAFLSDMGHRPSPLHTLERIDNDGPYSPDNCRWATWDEQGRNKRNSRLITFRGRTLTAFAWSREVPIPARTIMNRLAAGWPADRILTEPPAATGTGRFRKRG